MADTGKFYTKFFQSLANKELDLDTDTIKLMALTSSYTPVQGTHRYKSDLTNEVSGTNYTATGIALPSPVFSTSGLVFTFDAADVAWPGAIPACRYLVAYDSSPATDATRPLIGYMTFDVDKQPSGVIWNTGGIFTVTVA